MFFCGLGYRHGLRPREVDRTEGGGRVGEGTEPVLRI